MRSQGDVASAPWKNRLVHTLPRNGLFDEQIIGNSIREKGRVLAVFEIKLLKIQTVYESKKVIRLFEALTETKARSSYGDGLPKGIGARQAVGDLYGNITAHGH